MLIDTSQHMAAKGEGRSAALLPMGAVPGEPLPSAASRRTEKSVYERRNDDQCTYREEESERERIESGLEPPSETDRR